MKLYTIAAINRILGVPKSEIAQLVKSGIISDGLDRERGLFRLEETAREMLRHYRKAEGERAGRTADYAEERAKLARAKRLSAEYDLREKEGELHRSADVEYALSKMLVSFRSRITSIPTRAAAQCARLTDEAEIYSLLEQLTNEALEELSSYDEIFGGEGEGGNETTE